MRHVIFAGMMLIATLGAYGGDAEAIELKLCGAFEQPGTYTVNRRTVHLQDIMAKIQPILLARKDVALVVDGGERRMVDLSRRDANSLLRGGEQVYLYELIMDRRGQ